MHRGSLLVFSMLIGFAGLATGQTPRFRITIDTLCYGWKVCVHDSTVGGGVKGAALLNGPPNVSFDVADDPTVSNTINFQPARREACFTIRVNNPGNDAYGPLYIIDDKGKGILVPLQYYGTASIFSALPSGRFTVQLFDPVSNKYLPSHLGEEICTEHLLINKSPVSRSYRLNDVSLRTPFRLKSTSKPLGSTIRPGDTLKIGICFAAADTMAYTDSVFLTMGECIYTVPVFGQAGTGIILADDKNFGAVSGGQKKCADIKVKNVGNKPFTLDRNWVMIASEEFHLDTTNGSNPLPITIAPGKFHKFAVCYTPRSEGPHSTWILWNTDIRPPFRNQLKPFSDFSGSVLVPHVNWDRASEKLRLGADLDTVHRVNLISDGLGLAELSGIWIEGPDADEFRVVATQFNMNPPTFGGTTLSKGKTMWVDVEFKANLSKPRNAVRTAYLLTSTTFGSTITTTMVLEGHLGTAKVATESERVLTMYPNPAQDKISLHLQLEAADDVSVTIYDILGREVARQMFGACPSGVNALEVALSHVEDGIYYIRVAVGGTVSTLPLEIRR